MNDLKLIEAYRSELQNYSLEQLRHLSSEGVWSIGQMYDHVILVAHEYLDNMEACAASLEEQKLGKTEFGKRLFENGGFPSIKIKLPDELNAPPNNSDTMEELMSRLDEVMQRMRQWEIKVDDVNPYYKVQHDGFGWLNAREWYDLVGMHFRHHLRQKEELVEKLRLSEVK
ncbi:DinB family protein [Sutcliffiella sp. NPDC057660]|uniref:DinB family protein n=1 Tax=Sutcliffiella sp. NPDC057660 TaxID=3346199 RepID=UPI003678BEB8